MARVHHEWSARPKVATGADFRALMASFPTGVAVVTAFGRDGQPRGMTCSSVCSVSLEPPTLLVCLRSGSPTLAAVMWNGGFALNLLHMDAHPTAALFASGEPDRFDAVRWEAAAPCGPHLYDDAHTVADCRVTHWQPVGDHTVVFGETVGVRRGPQQPPLLYGLRRYAAWPVQG